MSYTITELSSEVRYLGAHLMSGIEFGSVGVVVAKGGPRGASIGCHMVGGLSKRAVLVEYLELERVSRDFPATCLT